MSRCVCVLSLLLVMGCGGSEGWETVPRDSEWYPDDVLRVPQFAGDDVLIPRKDMHHVTATGWAMMIDRDMFTDRAERTEELFDEMCRRWPALKEQVDKLLQNKWAIDAKHKQLMDEKRQGVVVKRRF